MNESTLCKFPRKGPGLPTGEVARRGPESVFRITGTPSAGSAVPNRKNAPSGGVPKKMGKSSLRTHSDRADGATGKEKISGSEAPGFAGGSFHM